MILDGADVRSVLSAVNPLPIRSLQVSLPEVDNVDNFDDLGITKYDLAPFVNLSELILPGNGFGTEIVTSLHKFNFLTNVNFYSPAVPPSPILAFSSVPSLDRPPSNSSASSQTSRSTSTATRTTWGNTFRFRVTRSPYRRGRATGRPMRRENYWSLERSKASKSRNEPVGRGRSNGRGNIGTREGSIFMGRV